MEEKKDRVVELLREYMSLPEEEVPKRLVFLKEAVSILSDQGKTLAAHK
jgi:hypothetical protein